MKNKKLFALLTSWLLVVSLLVGCTITMQSGSTEAVIQISPNSTPSSLVATSLPTTGATTPSLESTLPSTAPTQPSVAPTTPSTVPTVPPTVPPTTPPAPTPDPVPEGSSFAIHFIDVGQADAALVLCDGKAMLIDGGNAPDSNLIYTYLKRLGITHLEYIIGTHAHEDHIGGIPGALQVATVDTVYCPTRSYSTKAFKNFVNAVNNRGASITIPTIGTTFNLGSATCTILAINTDSKDLNNTSIVMRIVYGETSFLFTGDAEDVVEKALLDKGVALKSDVLKVGHHGSNSSTTYRFLREVMPEYAVICVGTGNTYGHPTENTLSRLRDADVTTFRTDKQGDILCVSDGKTVTFTPSRNANENMYAKIGPNSTQA